MCACACVRACVRVCVCLCVCVFTVLVVCIFLHWFGVSFGNISVMGRYSFKRELCLTIQSFIYPFLVYEYVIYLWFYIICVGVDPSFFILFCNLISRHVSLFWVKKFVRCFTFLFDMLCKQNLLFSFLPILTFMYSNTPA